MLIETLLSQSALKAMGQARKGEKDKKGRKSSQDKERERERMSAKMSPFLYLRQTLLPLSDYYDSIRAEFDARQIN